MTQNLPVSIRSSWPWKLQMLDTQSATAATTIAASLVFARAQYASVVRPMLGWTGSVVEVAGRSDELAWRVRLLNGASAASRINITGYRVILNPAVHPSTPASDSWLSREEAISCLRSAGMSHFTDFELRHIGPAFPLSNATPNAGVVGIFTRRAMELIEELHVRVEATDQAGDTHQRTVYCMSGAIRQPTSITLE
ncbi:hypothetical protein J7E88_24725 [Streptomyces sp. ISL-10]|uniref:hypothetical protein n=1 Tax=Streptomyces sp. ISL-10 TaxID=2819172 RepID=UPI001BE95231|nr:hypothetical protein [Streptomyces sp. ISL-10]MBT2368440.1 hypothetical protein [Streptomyces sp. ISL-10]